MENIVKNARIRKQKTPRFNSAFTFCFYFLFISLLLIIPGTTAVTADSGDQEGTICDISDIVSFTAFFDCCDHLTILAPTSIAVFHGILCIRKLWDPENEDELSLSYEYPLIGASLSFSLGFCEVFIDLLAAAANFKVDGSIQARCFAVGSCFHSFGIITAGTNWKWSVWVAAFFVSLGHVLELVSFLYINKAAGYTAFLMICNSCIVAIISMQLLFEKNKEQSVNQRHKGDNIQFFLLVNQISLFVVVAVAFLSTLKASYLMLMLPEVPVETIIYLMNR